MKETYRFNPEELYILVNKLLRLHPKTQLTFTINKEEGTITLDYQEPKSSYLDIHPVLSLLLEAKKYVLAYAEALSDPEPTDLGIESAKARVLLRSIDAVFEKSK